MSNGKRKSNVVENPTKILCPDCNDMVPKEIRVSNSEKNKGKEYYRCPKCNKFLIWAELSAYDAASETKKVESTVIKTIPREQGPCVEWMKIVEQLEIMNKNLERIISAVHLNGSRTSLTITEDSSE